MRTIGYVSRREKIQLLLQRLKSPVPPKRMLATKGYKASRQGGRGGGGGGGGGKISVYVWQWNMFILGPLHSHCTV